ncbi:MAG: hypothetical protein SGILL_006851 [Bacillariaceae sp.]
MTDDSMETSRRSLWPEDEVEVLPNGFLKIKDFDGEDDGKEEQPLLLQSTARLLRGLYPSLSLQEIHDYEPKTITESANAPPTPVKEDTDEEEEDDGGDVEMKDAHEDTPPATDTETTDSKIPARYQCYQHLKRLENISTWSSLALQDIQTFRHRGGPKQPRGNRRDRANLKVQALEHQQQRLLQMRSESNNSNEQTNEDMEEDDNSNDSGADDEKVGNNNVERLVRTINSIRALYPHLLPMLHHKRRNDKQLVIGKTRYKARKKGAMCWLLGAVGFDVATSKALKSIHRDAGVILERFIAVDLAQNIVDNGTETLEFWTPSNWIRQVQLRCNPDIPNPMDLLSTKLGKSVDETLVIAEQCDKICASHRPAQSTDNDQHYQRAVSKLHRRLSNILTRAFQGARLSIYGSCLSNLSLGKGSDVDLSLWIPFADELKRDFDDGFISADEYSRKMANLVHQANRKLKFMQSEFRNMVAITRARIPVITGTFAYADNPYTEDGSIDFDICFLNDIAVANSGLLREYSLVDPRVRTLMMSVKQWAKEYGINSAKDNHISSYTWMNLVVFYLQCIRFLPNLQSPALMEAVGLVPDRQNNYWHFVNNLDTCTLTWNALRKANVWVMPSELDKVPLPALLYGFFEFFGFRFPWTFAVSIKQGDISVSKLATRKVCSFYSIEDPFETYDSHCPHDLCTPCSEIGSIYITQCLRDGESYLRNLLSDENANKEKLWSDTPALEPEAKTVNTKQKQVWKRFGNRGHGNGNKPNGKDTPAKKPAQGSRTRHKQGGRNTGGKGKNSPAKQSNNGDGNGSKPTGNGQQGSQSQQQGDSKKDHKQQGKSQEGQPQQQDASKNNQKKQRKPRAGKQQQGGAKRNQQKHKDQQGAKKKSENGGNERGD